MTSLCVDTRGAQRRQDLLFADYLEGLRDEGDAEICRLVRGNVAGDHEMVCRWEPGGWGNRWWEPRFLEAGEFDCFHCFRTLEQVPWQAPRALVTVLPGTAPKRIPSPQLCRLVVPSEADRTELVLAHDVDPNQILTLTPALRRSFQASQPRPKSGEKGILFVTSSRSSQDKKLLALLKRKHHRLVHFHIDLSQTKPLPLDEWERLLSQVQLVFYLVDDPFDWGTLAVESAHREVPVIHSDGNRFLKEHWNGAELGLRHYLLEHPTPGELKKTMALAQKLAPPTQPLEAFFRPLYREAPVSLRPDLRPSPSPVAPNTRGEAPREPEDEPIDYSL